MQVKHMKNLMAGQPGLARVTAICWSPNNQRLAVADSSLYVHLYDEQGDRRDKFPTKAMDGKGGKDYFISALTFSPDSAKIAVGQSDNVLSIYRIGLEWGEKKRITNKYPQSSAVTCATWPNTSNQGVELVVLGTQEGKVKVGIPQSNKSKTLYSHEHPVVSVSTSLNGQNVVCGHQDGAVYIYRFEGEDGSDVGAGAMKLFTHSCAPTVLSWGEHICAAGADAVLTFYSAKNGQRAQSFDYPIGEEGSFTAGGFNPSGHSLAVASRDQFRVYDYNVRSRKWSEGQVVRLPHSYTIPVMSWKYDGSRLVTGTITGAVDMFDACLKRYRLRGAFEFTYVSQNQVIVKRLATGTRIVLRSNMGYEIQRVNVYQDRYLVAHTSTTLLVGDLVSCQLSEVPWQLTGKERFVFDNPQVCMVFNVGELCLIEYGRNTLLGTCRTEERSVHRISVRVHDPDKDAAAANGDAEAAAAPATTSPSQTSKRVIAYLLDKQTIQVDNLVSGVAVARVSHDARIDWLELNYNANKLLFRDKQHRLFLYDFNEQQRTTLLNYCTYVQWVPGSDVVAAQNRVELCIWYNIDAPDRVTVVPLSGEVEGIERGNGKTEVIVDEGVSTVAYGLDEALIEFGTAMDERQFGRACDLLDSIDRTPSTEAMWSALAKVAMQERELRIAARCFAALGDVAKVQALQRIHTLAVKAARESQNATDGYDHYEVQAELCILNKEFKKAEQLYLEHGKVDQAISMWEEMNRFDESIALAESRSLEDLPNRRARYYSWLMETGQFDKAGEVKEREGKHMEAINLYLRGGTPARAANVVTNFDLRPEQQLLEAIAAALFKAQVYEKAGEFFEKLKMDDRAIDAYKRGRVYSRAVEFAKREHPEKVPALEEAWGDYLVSQQHVDQAINHYNEAGRYGKAVKAAISSRQWSKAAQLLDSHRPTPGTPEAAEVKKHYKSIARHYEDVHQYAEAERFFILAEAVRDAVDMYSRAGLTDHMYRVAQRHLDQKELVALFVEQAKQLEAKGDYAGAERIYLKVNEPDQVIVMYKRTRDFTNMIRLVQAYRPDYLLKTHLSLGAQFEKEGNLKSAETHYVAGKDWGRAVNMYRDRSLWDDAVRVAKVNGGAASAKQVVLSRAMSVEAEEGVQLLQKFGFMEAGIDAALEAGKFDLALQWAEQAQPAKMPYVYLKYAMHYEDQGDFRMAEDAFLKSGKPREAIDMYVHQHEFNNAMRVAESHDASAIPIISAANGRVCFQQGKYQEAEALYLRAGAPETLLKLYVEARMLNDAQRIAKEHCPEMQGDVAKRIALQSNDPQKAGAVLEENGEYALAIEMYLGATAATVPEPTALANVWVRAVKVAQKNARSSLKETLRHATDKLKAANRFVEAGKCFEDCEDYKAAINMYVQGKKFDMAETLAKRISPELEDYVKRAIVQDSIGGGGGGAMRDARMVEEMDPEAAMKAYISNNDFENATRMAKQRSVEDQQYVAALEMQHHVRQGRVLEALAVVSRPGVQLDFSDFRFFGLWLEVAQKVIAELPSDSIDLTALHAGLVKVVEHMGSSGQPADEVARADALLHILHVYYMSRKMTHDYDLPEYGLKLMLSLPRWIPHISPDKAFYDAGMAARRAGDEAQDIAFLYLNRALDIREKIEDGEADTSGLDNTDFDQTDFPKVYRLPRTAGVPVEAMEEANSWVLTVSIETDATADRKLPLTKDPQSGEDMFVGSLRSPKGDVFPECAVTGYPILGGGLLRCKNCQRTANQEHWNKFVMVAKQCPWCSNPQNPDFNF